MRKNYIKLEASKFKSEYKAVIKQIEKYDRIAIFRHIKPDFDALGTQFGLATFIKENFPNKEVITLGDNHVTFTNRIYPEVDKVNDSWFDTPFLGIVVDVGEKKRIADPRFERAEFLIKFDHHPSNEETHFDIGICDIELAAASELVCNFLFTLPKKYKVSKNAAWYLYSALVGDSGRFQYSSTSAHTFEISSLLIETGINITEIYAKMYEKTIDDLDSIKFVLNNFKVSEHGVAYYVMTQKDLDTLKLTNERGKENVNTFANIRGINIWCSITEDVTVPCYRISIRSRDYVINEVAKKYEGGGHAQAAGAQIPNLDALPQFIEDLEKVILEGK
ncbi:MAG: bifunctional oligoribonuclease/PAP phosphatase NrnA [Bacilli bacterium]|nr:bifunctional oligoribonuclease/PAP phosphatase NrnA [Bacilli bacterium]